jgi:hypothetical protein
VAAGRLTLTANVRYSGSAGVIGRCRSTHKANPCCDTRSLCPTRFGLVSLPFRLRVAAS